MIANQQDRRYQLAATELLIALDCSLPELHKKELNSLLLKPLLFGSFCYSGQPILWLTDSETIIFIVYCSVLLLESKFSEDRNIYP